MEINTNIRKYLLLLVYILYIITYIYYFLCVITATRNVLVPFLQIQHIRAKTYR